MSLVLEGISKSFGEHRVVQSIDLTVSDGELFVLLGASGSGKSTLLRLIAGLIQPDEGQIKVGEKDITNLPPQLRDAGFVFQNYALFRHLSVNQNVAFGLKIRGHSKADQLRKCEELLDLVGLGGLGNRLPAELSGGQRQRVALARALAYEPKMLLLDEPFGALDVKIRGQLRRSCREIQQQLKILTVLVTHDQEEAFELADRVGVLDRGRLVEVNSPAKLYHSPQTERVAIFIGGGNVLVGRAEKKLIRLGETLMPFPADAAPHEDGAPVRILFRPETVRFQKSEFTASDPVLPIGRGKVLEQTFTGPTERVRFELVSLQGARPLWPAPSYGQRYAVIDAVSQSSPFRGEQHKIGEEFHIGLGHYHVLAPSGLKFLVCLDRLDECPSALSATTTLIEASHGFATLFNVQNSTTDLSAARKSADSLCNSPHYKAKVVSGSLAHELAVELQQGFFDLTLMELAQGDSPRVKRLRQAARRTLLYTHSPVLLAYPGKHALKKILVCTAAGEPGKSDIQLGARIARHLKAEVTVFHACSPNYSKTDRQRVDKYLNQAKVAFNLVGVSAGTLAVDGSSPVEAIKRVANDGGYDLVIIGAPLKSNFDNSGHNDLLTELVSSIETSLLVVPMVLE